MQSAFASYVPEWDFQEDAPLANPNIWEHKKHAEFVLYKMPLMLETHASSPLLVTSNVSKKHKQHRRQKSVVLDVVGIVMQNPSKSVSFSPDICKQRVFKTDSWSYVST